MRKVLGAIVLIIAGLLFLSAAMFAAINVQDRGADAIEFKAIMVGTTAAIACVIALIGSLIWGIGAWRHHFGHLLIWSVVAAVVTAGTMYLVGLDPKMMEIMEASRQPGEPHINEMFNDVIPFLVVAGTMVLLGWFLLATARRRPRQS